MHEFINEWMNSWMSAIKAWEVKRMKKNAKVGPNWHGVKTFAWRPYGRTWLLTIVRGWLLSILLVSGAGSSKNFYFKLSGSGSQILSLSCLRYITFCIWKKGESPEKGLIKKSSRKMRPLLHSLIPRLMLQKMLKMVAIADLKKMRKKLDIRSRIQKNWRPMM